MLLGLEPVTTVLRDLVCIYSALLLVLFDRSLHASCFQLHVEAFKVQYTNQSVQLKSCWAETQLMVCIMQTVFQLETVGQWLCAVCISCKRTSLNSLRNTTCYKAALCKGCKWNMCVGGSVPYMFWNQPPFECMQSVWCGCCQQP